ncbi:MAG: hypothetical protein KGO48_11635 [Alphaproteobacteria bacterium]|nr:hypothetical protein [Alphaproteobacteria bacterium]
MRVTALLAVVALTFVVGVQTQTLSQVAVPYTVPTDQQGHRGFCSEPSTYVTAPRSDAPPLVNATVGRFPSIAFRRCNFFSVPRYYLRAPETITDGVCMLVEKEVVPAVDVNSPNLTLPRDTGPTPHISWSNPPPLWNNDDPQIILNVPTELMAIQTNGKCPALDDPSYIPVQKVSPAGFASVMQYLQTLGSSENNFAAAISRVSSCGADQYYFKTRHLSPEEAKADLDRKIASLHKLLVEQQSSLRIFRLELYGGAYFVSAWDSAKNGPAAPFVATLQVSGSGLELTQLCGIWVA